MEKFNEYSGIANVIITRLEVLMVDLELMYGVSFKDPRHDVSRRFLNEIVEFEPLEEVKRSSLMPWEEG